MPHGTTSTTTLNHQVKVAVVIVPTVPALT